MLVNCSRPRMPLESRESLLANALVWPALNHYPAAKQEDNSSRRTEKVSRCTATSCSQPDPSWPLTPSFLQLCQVGGHLFIYLCFIDLDAASEMAKCISKESSDMSVERSRQAVNLRIEAFEIWEMF